MTGLDGLIEARSRQISDVVRRTKSRAVAGSGRGERQTTLGEKAMAIAGIGEEATAKVIGKLLTDNPKYDQGIGNYHTQVGFADIFRDAGVDSTTAAMLGIAAAIINPLDPLNKLKILAPTKLGKAARYADNLVKDSDGIWRLSTKKIAEEIASKEKAIASGQYADDVVQLAQRSVNQAKQTLNHQTELNTMLEELQARGVKVNELRLAGSTFDQVRQGQRHLIGFGNPLSMEHVPGFSTPANEVSVYGLKPSVGAKLIKATTSAKNKIVTPLKDAAYKIADFVGTPAAGKTEKTKQLATDIKSILDNQKATLEDINRDLQSRLQNFVDSYGPEGKDEAINDALQITSAMEFRHSGVKEVAIDELAKLSKAPPSLRRGLGVEVRKGREQGLTDEQKIRLTQSGVEDSELPTAIRQFEEANAPSIRVGKSKQHEVKLLGRYVVVKTSDAKTALSDLNELDGIYGNRVWAKHEKGDGVFLVQLRHPSAARITKTTDFEPAHLKNLESIAAQISNDKKGFTAIKPEDILVAPSGAVQIINPSIIAEFKSQKDAVANSRQVLESLADAFSFPRGSVRELQSLKNVETARAVKRGVGGLTFRSLGSSIDIGGSHAPAYDILEQSVNTDAYKDFVRASYDGKPSVITVDTQFHNAVEFEQANNIEFHRQQIRKAIEQGLEPTIEPIHIVVDDLHNLHIRNGHDRLTAAILEGFETVPIHNSEFVGDVLAKKGFYAGKTSKLTDLWNATEDSSGIRAAEVTRGIVAANYSLIPRSGETVKLTAENLIVDAKINNLLNRFITAGPQFVGKARNQRIESALAILTENFGSVRNATIRLAEAAEQAPDVKTFVSQVEAMLTNQKTGQGIRLDNTLRHPESQNVLAEIQGLAVKMLDDLASNGVLTTTTVKDPRRILLASDSSDLVVRVMDPDTNTLRVYGNQMTTAHLKNNAEAFINKTTTAADVEPYARIELIGADGVVKLEVKDLVDGQHPKLTDVMEPVKVFSISDEYADVLKQEGVFIADGKNADNIKTELEKKGLSFFTKGKQEGVLLGEKKVTVKSTKTGTFLPGQTESVIVRPEFTFFVTRSGAMVIGTKHRNVNDLLGTVFEEGPRYFEEFGVMTTGKVIVSNPFGSKMAKIGVGEMRNLEDRLRTLATRFKDLGLSNGTVLDIRVPFDDAVWRSMYGERVTIGDVLDESFKLKIPKDLLNHVPDIQVLAPGRLGAEGQELGVVGIEKTRLENKKLQDLFKALEDYNDKIFLEQAKAGLPINYYSSWFGRHLTKKMKEALNELWIKYPDKQSATFKNIEPAFKGRVITDLTTLEVNTITKRLQKEGIASVESVIADTVKELRKGYVLKPTKELANTLVAISKIMPEGIDFFQLDPIWSTALAARDAVRAIGRKQIVDSLKASGVTVWTGSVKELDAIKVGKSKKALELENKIGELSKQLTDTQVALERLGSTTPDIAATQEQARLAAKVDEITQKLAKAVESKATLLDKIGEGKVLDTMVDLQSEQVWIRGEDTLKLIEDGVIKQGDILGDPSDAFVRIPIKKYASVLDENKAEIFLFPKEIAGVVQKYFSTTTRTGFGKFLGVWDSIHALWRNWTLFPIPAYHFRNLISNGFMAYLGGVTDPYAYQQAHSIMGLIDGHRKGALTKKQVQEALGAISFPSASGQVVTGQQLWDSFSQHGMLSGGLNYNEFNAFGDVVRASEFERLSVKAGLRPSSELAGSWLFDNTALRSGVKAAAYVENRFRLATFIDALTKGHTEVKGGFVLSGFDAAAMHTKKVFYDYSDLSAFERSWLRRVIPFYSWSRHNIPRMMETLLTDPVKHYRTAKFFHDIEEGAVGGAVGENELPEWMNDRYGLVVEKTKEGNYIVKTGDGFLPMIDAYKMLAGGGIFKMLKDGMTPFVKVPIEQLTNYSLYSERSIEAVPGQRSGSFTLGELGFSRRSTTEGPLGVLNLLLNESMLRTFFRPGGEIVSKVIDPIFDGKEGPSVKLGVYAFMIGKFYEINPEQARMAIYSNWNQRQRQLTGLRNDALEQGDMKSVEDADRMLTWLRMQYPGEREK